MPKRSVAPQKGASSRLLKRTATPLSPPSRTTDRNAAVVVGFPVRIIADCHCTSDPLSHV